MNRNTRFATFICCIIQAGTIKRNFPISSQGDVFLRHVMMWSLFLPDSPCSLDDGSFDLTHVGQLFRETQDSVLCCGSVALNIQLGSMYLFSTAHKSFEAYITNADAVNTVFQYEGYAAFSPFVQNMRDMTPDFVLKLLSRQA